MKVVVGSYGAPPRPLQSAGEFEILSAGALALPLVDGLELPYAGEGSPWQDVASVRPGRHVLTTVPATMSAVEKDPAFGLASGDEESRAAAVRLIAAARDFAAAVGESGGARIETVQLHSAPGMGASRPDAFARSLDEIASWDWAGADLAVEHCDALVPAHPPAKGFLRLEEELAIAGERGIGAVINWGRSAIETRDAEGPAAHIAAAAAQGALTGVVFSGCAATPGAYGDPWADRHLPIRDWGADPLSDAGEASILTRQEVERCVALALRAPELQYIGVKVKAPSTAAPEQWLDVIGGNLAVLTGALR
ncbi:DUF4862 family protein [Microbacterium tumbae]